MKIQALFVPGVAYQSTPWWIPCAVLIDVIGYPITESMGDTHHSLQEGTAMSLITQSGATDPEHDPPTEPEIDGRRPRAVPAPRKRAGSGGPRTPAGKAKSSKNAMKAGIFSKSPVVGDERPEDWEAHRQGTLGLLRARWLPRRDVDR